MVQEKATLTRPLEVERWRLASPPMAQILQNSVTEAARLATIYWVSILDTGSVDVHACLFPKYSLRQEQTMPG